MGALAQLVEDFISQKGRFEGSGITVSPRQVRGYRKNGIIPMKFIEWLESYGFPDAVEIFKNINKYHRTLDTVSQFLAGDIDRIFLILSDAESGQKGNFRYSIASGRKGPETILNGMVEDLHEG